MNRKEVRKVYSLLMLQKDHKILLGYKKRGFGEGKWNGFGGKLEDGENAEEAAIREMKEESGLQVDPKDIEKIGIIEFSFIGDPKVMEVHIFSASDFTGVLTESDEMMPKWFSIEEIPYQSMFPDDRIWYPLMFDGKKFKGHCQLKGEDTIVYHTIESVEKL